MRDSTDLALDISEMVIKHAGIKCNHCSNILKQISNERRSEV